MATCCLWASCSREHYQRSADNEVYGILDQRRSDVLGKTNATFKIDTAYSTRKPADIPPPEIIQQRLETPKLSLTLTEAIKTGIARSPNYQLQKETVYLAALALTLQRYNFTPKWASSVKPALTRNANGVYDTSTETDVSVSQLLKSGGQLSISALNDVLAFYSGGAPHNTTAFSANFTQPLMRGSGYQIVTENLTQAERNVVYAINTFARYEQTFAVGIVTSYFRLLQQRDVIRNDYSTYQNLKLVRERAEALGKDRLANFQVDQARQQELTAMSTYISDVQSHLNSLDNFKITLGIPVGTALELDESPLKELRSLSLPGLELTQDQGHRIAVLHRFDLQNTINQFEDAKRKIEVTADQLSPDLNILSHVDLPQPNGYDYSRFNVNQYRAYAEVQLNLPLDRLQERNNFRSSQITFEQQLRTLALALDTIRNSIQTDLRTLEQTSKNYAIQQNAVRVAQSSVDGGVLLLQAGRIDMLNLLTQQSALLTAQNAFQQALVDYHVARWTLLSDLGIIRIDIDRFWMADQTIPQPGGPDIKARGPAIQAHVLPRPTEDQIIPPDKLFGQSKTKEMP